MARGHTERREAKRSAQEEQHQDRRLAQRLARVERDVGEMRKVGPPRPEDVVARRARAGERPDFLRVSRGNANYETPTNERLAALKGRSRSDIVSDRERGASSPVGAGSHSKPAKRKER